MGGKKISALTESTTVPSNSYTIIVDGTVNKKIKLETITKNLSDKVTDLENELNVNTNKVNEQETTISNLSNKINAQGTTISNLSNKVNTQETTTNNLSDRLTGLEGELSVNINKVNEQGTTITNLSNKVDAQEIVTNSLSDRVNEVNTQLNNIEDITTLKEDKIFALKEDYISVITNNKIKDYSYDNLQSDINLIATKYVGKVTKELVGKSVLNREINALILGNKNGANKLLVFSGHHAREQHMASLILKQIELYCENWDNKVNGELLSDIFKNSAIFFIPCINPDGLELCRVGINSVPSSETERISQIKLALETKIRNGLLLNKDVNKDWDLYSSVVWNGEVGTLPNYTFRNEDMFMWKANANGVDLHYNCWGSENEEVIKSYAISSGFPTSFASENYIGEVGMGEQENVALQSFIDKYGLKRYSISYHGKGPTVFWNYKQTGKQLQRNYRITEELCNISNTVYSESNNSPIGYTGYMYSKYKTDNLLYCCVRETGWGTNEINKDNNYTLPSSGYTICPLPDNQLEPIFEAEKYIPLFMLSKYCRRQDLKHRDILITEFDSSFTTKNSNLDFVKVDNRTGEIVQGGVKIIEFKGEDYQYLTFDLQKPFTKTNRGGYVNCYSNTLDIIKKVKHLAITKDSLTRVTIRVFLDSPLGSKDTPYTVPVNFIIYGE